MSIALLVIFLGVLVLTALVALLGAAGWLRLGRGWVRLLFALLALEVLAGGIVLYRGAEGPPAALHPLVPANYVFHVWDAAGVSFLQPEFGWVRQTPEPGDALAVLELVASGETRTRIRLTYRARDEHYADNWGGFVVDTREAATERFQPHGPVEVNTAYVAGREALRVSGRVPWPDQEGVFRGVTEVFLPGGPRHVLSVRYAYLDLPLGHDPDLDVDFERLLSSLVIGRR